MNKSSVKNLRAMLVLGTSLSAIAATGFSQQAAAASDDKVVKLEKYVVTGSNIPTTETASEARTFPVQTIDRRAIEASGIFNTAELLQKTVLSNGGSVPISNNGGGFTPGASSTSLRGLGPEATLVLINGRRMAAYPVGAGGTTAFVDLNTIPLAAVERIEVLKDGASATYGADAVAGVVNIILRKDFNGAVANVSLGNTTDLDATEFTASMVYGVTGDKGSITIGANFQKRNAIFNRDRAYSAIPPFLSTNSSPPNFQLTRATVEQALGLAPGGNIPGIAAGTNIFFGTTGPTVGGLSTAPAAGNQNANNFGNVPANLYTYSTGRLSRFNFNEFSGSLPEINRKGVFMVWDRQLASPNARVYGDAFFQQVRQVDEFAPYATGNFASPGQISIVIPARTANPILTPTEIANGNQRTAVAGAFNPFNPFNQDISGSSRIRLAEFGNRIFQNNLQAFAITGGIRVDEINDKWSIDAKARFSGISNQTNDRLISTSRLLRSLNAADPIFNPSSSSFIGSTLPYNPFGFHRNTIPSNSAPVAFATVYLRNVAHSILADLGISASTGELFELAAGNVGFAIGADYRREAIAQTPDSALQSGEILASTPASPIDNQRKIASYFTEFEIPLFSEKNSTEFARSLSMNIAARFENFLTSDRQVFVPKIGLRWMPFDDTLVFRTSYGKGFREPSLFELFAPPVNGLTPITDTLAGRGNLFEPEQPVTISGNPQLEAEKTNSFNFGVIWSPKDMLQGFTLAVDVWQIEREGTVASDLQNVVDRAAGRIPGGLQPGEAVLRDPAGNILQVRGRNRNLGETRINGADFTSSYVWKTQDWGRFDTGVNATYIRSYKSSSNPGVPLAELIGAAVPGSSSDDGYLQWKSQVFTSWAWKGLNARVTGTYTDSFEEVSSDGATLREVDSTMVYDLQVSYTFFPSKGSSDAKVWSDLTMTAGVLNLFDKDPPFAEGGGGNSTGYPGHLYTNTGQFVYVGLEKKF